MIANPSPLQSAIFDFVATDSRSLVIEAGAGSGKSSVIEHCVGLLPTHKSIVVLAFNKSIATAMAARLPSHVQCKTFHSLCYQAYRNATKGYVKVDGDKTFNILRDMFKGKRRESEVYTKFVQRLVGYAKNAGMGVLTSDTYDSWQELIWHYNLTPDTEDFDQGKAIGYAQECLAVGVAMPNVIDFDDQLYLCLLRGLTFDKFQYVFVDELQDLSAVQLELTKRLLGPESRFIGVGDPRQAIYGFRGAAADGMKNFANAFDAVVLPLSISYRCSRAVGELVSARVPGFSVHEAAPDGSVQRPSRYDESFFHPTDAILCRNTLPVVTLAYRFLRKRIGCKILGREIGQGLIALVKQMNTTDMDELESRLVAYREREVGKLLRQGKDSQAGTIEDKVNCVLIFVQQMPEGQRTVDHLTRTVEQLFTNDSSSSVITLCTIHKSKGLEWPRVFILDASLMPSKYAKRPWELQQEDNLWYVAVTRAREHLFFIQSDDWRTEDQPRTEKARLLTIREQQLLED